MATSKKLETIYYRATTEGNKIWKINLLLYRKMADILRCLPIEIR